MSIIIKRKHQKPLCVSGVYIPPKAKIDKSFDTLDNLCVYIASTGLEWIVGGDFNVDLLDKKNSKARKLSSQFVTRNSLTQVITLPTRRAGNKHSLLDHIYE